MKRCDVEKGEWSQDVLNVRCLWDGEMGISNRQLCVWVCGINLGVVSMKPMDVDEITQAKGIKSGEPRAQGKATVWCSA